MNYIPAADSADKQIQKVHRLWVDSSMWMLYCHSHTMYIQVRHGNETKNYHNDFQSNVIDFVPLFQSKFYGRYRFINSVEIFIIGTPSGFATKAVENHIILAILTEHNLAFLTKTTSGAQAK